MDIPFFGTTPCPELMDSISTPTGTEFVTCANSASVSKIGEEYKSVCEAGHVHMLSLNYVTEHVTLTPQEPEEL